MSGYLESIGLLLVLLNPFLMVVYLVDVFQRLEKRRFAAVVLRAGLIGLVVFSVFALIGDAFFSKLMHAEFASFQIFGGVIFLLIGLQFVFQGPEAIRMLRGDSQNLAGAIAMPVLIGPGTISASIVIGKRHDPVIAVAAVAAAVFVCLVVIIALKNIHDFVRPRNEGLVQHYIEIAGRISALIIGTFAVEMIMRGLVTWGESF